VGACKIPLPPVGSLRVWAFADAKWAEYAADVVASRRLPMLVQIAWRLLDQPKRGKLHSQSQGKRLVSMPLKRD
jgi:hypothetical protein